MEFVAFEELMIKEFKLINSQSTNLNSKIKLILFLKPKKQL